MISIIVPVYNVEKYINRCIDSILAQTFTDFELILVDDGSSDNCGSICDEYKRKDKRIQVYHKENGGAAESRNIGIDWAIKNSNSEWIAFVDSDDWIHPSYFELLIDNANKYNCMISSCEYIRVSDETELNPDPIKNPKVMVLDVEDYFVAHNTVATGPCGKIYKKELFETIRFPEGTIMEDEYVSYRILFCNSNIVFVDEKMYFYFHNENSVMNQPWGIKNLASINALEMQYTFFCNSSFKKAFIFVVEKYIWFLRDCFDHLEQYDYYEKKQWHLLHIRKNMRKCLRQKCINKPIEKNERLYAIAYPHLINCYYLKKRIKKKIKRIFAR